MVADKPTKEKKQSVLLLQFEPRSFQRPVHLQEAFYNPLVADESRAKIETGNVPLQELLDTFLKCFEIQKYSAGGASNFPVRVDLAGRHYCKLSLRNRKRPA